MLRLSYNQAFLPHIVVILLFSISFVFISPSYADTYVCGFIAENVVWDASGNPYNITCDTIISPGTAVTVEPGVNVHFIANASLSVQGMLNAPGTSTGFITFTSSAETPAAGDWQYIYFENGSTGHLSHCEIGCADYGVTVYSSLNSRILISRSMVAGHQGVVSTVLFNPPPFHV